VDSVREGSVHFDPAGSVGEEGGDKFDEFEVQAEV
jgi:hypothetical protein